MNPERWQQIKEVFSAALALPSDQRPAFVVRTCARDPALQTEVESLLASHQEAAGFIEQPATESIVELAGELLSGERVGSYKLLREIGHGGMGTVYLAARADEQYRKQVAIKIVSRGMDTDFILRRFRSERQILASLDHPNIARLFDGGSAEDGRPYFVMEYIAGKPIDEYCDSRKLSTAERLKLFRTVCSAVQYAHENAVIHRDIKPANMLVTAQGIPKLLDFGIAKIVNPKLFSQTAHLTLTLQRVMTPEYASPEQVRNEPITVASDVYQLGILLYQLLTGHRPYRFKTRTPEEMAQVICEQEPEKPSTAVGRIEEEADAYRTKRINITPELVSSTREGEPHKLQRRLAGDLDNIVLKAMHKEPQRRYASVEQFSEDIGRHLEGLPVVARKDTLHYRANKFIRRHKAWVSAALSALMLMAAIAAAFYILLSRGEPNLLSRFLRSSQSLTDTSIRSIAVLPFKLIGTKNSDDEYLGLGIASAVITNVSQIDKLTVRPMGAVRKYAVPDIDPIAAARELKVDSVLDGTIQKSSDHLRVTVNLLRVSDGSSLWSDSLDSPIAELFTMQDDLSRQVAARVHLKISEAEHARFSKRGTSNPEAYEYYLKGMVHADRWSVSSSETETAILKFRKAVDLDPNYAQAHAQLALGCVMMVNLFDPKSSWVEEARRAMDKAAALDPGILQLHEARALLFASPAGNFRFEEAIRELRRAKRMNPNIGHVWLGAFYHHFGVEELFLPELQRAIEIDPTTTDALGQLAEGYVSFAKYDEAIATYKRLAEIEPYTEFSNTFGAMPFLHKNQNAEAKKRIEEAVAHNPKSPLVRSFEALLWAVEGKFAQAEARIPELIESSQKFRFIHHVAYNAALIYALQGKAEPAVKYLRMTADTGLPHYVMFSRDHFLDPIRSSPTFIQFMAELKPRWEAYRREFSDLARE